MSRCERLLFFFSSFPRLLSPTPATTHKKKHSGTRPTEARVGAIFEAFMARAVQPSRRFFLHTAAAELQLVFAAVAQATGASAAPTVMPFRYCCVWFFACVCVCAKGMQKNSNTLPLLVIYSPGSPRTRARRRRGTPRSPPQSEPAWRPPCIFCVWTAPTLPPSLSHTQTHKHTQQQTTLQKGCRGAGTCGW